MHVTGFNALIYHNLSGCDCFHPAKQSVQPDLSNYSCLHCIFLTQQHLNTHLSIALKWQGAFGRGALDAFSCCVHMPGAWRRLFGWFHLNISVPL
jgi:hypothetical protein